MADMNVYIYPNREIDDSAAQTARDGLNDSLNNLIGSTPIDSYNITIREVYPDVCSSTTTGVCTNSDQFYNEFKMWRTNESGYSEPGSHLGVSSVVSGGQADGGNGDCFEAREDDAFVSPKDAVMGNVGFETVEYQAGACQEVYHSFIDRHQSIDYPNDHTEEHDLGLVNGAGEATPMATTYENTHANHGTCQTDEAHNYWTIIPSQCTKDALSSTYLHEFGNWLDVKKGQITDYWNQYPIPYNIPDPVVISKPMTNNGDQPAHPRLKNVNKDSYEQRIEEWEYLDGIHKNETIGTLIIDTGKKIACNQELISYEVGRRKADSDWTSFSFLHYGQNTKTTDTPVVITSCQTFQGIDGDPITTRLKNISKTGFEVKCEEDESGDYHGPEEIGYIAIEPGIDYFVQNNDEYPFEVGRGSGFDSSWTSIAFERSYSEPIFLAEIQTYNGGNPCNLRYRNLGFSGVDVFVEEYQANDSETSHISEDVGYMVIEGNP